jgi:hypothetical protein
MSISLSAAAIFANTVRIDIISGALTNYDYYYQIKEREANDRVGIAALNVNEVLPISGADSHWIKTAVGINEENTVRVGYFQIDGLSPDSSYYIAVVAVPKDSSNALVKAFAQISVRTAKSAVARIGTVEIDGEIGRPLVSGRSAFYEFRVIIENTAFTHTIPSYTNINDWVRLPSGLEASLRSDIRVDANAFWVLVSGTPVTLGYSFIEVTIPGDVLITGSPLTTEANVRARVIITEAVPDPDPDETDDADGTDELDGADISDNPNDADSPYNPDYPDVPGNPDDPSDFNNPDGLNDPDSPVEPADPVNPSDAVGLSNPNTSDDTSAPVQ